VLLLVSMASHLSKSYFLGWRGFCVAKEHSANFKRSLDWVFGLMDGTDCKTKTIQAFFLRTAKMRPDGTRWDHGFLGDIVGACRVGRRRQEGLCYALSVSTLDCPFGHRGLKNTDQRIFGNSSPAKSNFTGSSWRF
jgi:hypothetical protein